MGTILQPTVKYYIVEDRSRIAGIYPWLQKGTVPRDFLFENSFIDQCAFCSWLLYILQCHHFTFAYKPLEILKTSSMLTLIRAAGGVYDFRNFEQV